MKKTVYLSRKMPIRNHKCPIVKVLSLIALITVLELSAGGKGVAINHFEDEHFSAERKQMVKTQLQARGIKDKRVLACMGKIPRHRFVPLNLRERAYEDTPLPIGYQQTISQPYIVALMAEAAQLDGTEKVLEIGTGCGYAAVVLGCLANTVYTVEIIPELAAVAKQILKELGINNVEVILGDGSIGLPEYALYSAILVTATAPKIPQPLKEQLAINGRLVIPVRRGQEEELISVVRTAADTYEEESLSMVRFVPLRGEKGWPERKNS